MKSILSEYPNIRLYAQMRPDADSLKHLVELQKSLPRQLKGRAVPARQIHMTLIHFGKIHDVYQIISSQNQISFEQYIHHLQIYIKETQAILPKDPVRIEPVGFALFGQRGGTLVVEYDAPTIIYEIHSELVNVLKRFLKRCEIEDVDAFMANDINFTHAPILRPHITLYKGYKGSLPNLPLKSIAVHPMELVYPPKEQA